MERFSAEKGSFLSLTHSQFQDSQRATAESPTRSTHPSGSQYVSTLHIILESRTEIDPDPLPKLRESSQGGQPEPV